MGMDIRGWFTLRQSPESIPQTMAPEPQTRQTRPDRQERSDFLLRACHDLRSVLRAVRTNAELLQAPEHQQSPDLPQILDFLVNGAKKADLLVNALSNYALALQVEPSSVPVSTGVLLRGALAKLATEIRESGAEVTYDDLPRVAGDPDRLMQVFENLVRNAIQHRGDTAPRIHVSAQRRNAEWIFAIRDNGPGIDAQDLERIFRPFERLRPGCGGAGLGLTICREVIASHQGKIWAESAAGNGTAVYFTIANT
jgi:two-component system, chemotaxis family, sensor kinase Cph1